MSNAPYLTIDELSQAVKRTIEGAFDYVRVRAEISQPRLPASGHIYFSLKDDRNVLACVIWRGTAARLSVRPEEGLEVICTGKMTIFGGQSRYQLVVSDIEIAGEGALLRQLEDRKKRLAEEGLFDNARKKPLPHFPRVIGVVTSPTGAVIRDILHRLDERFGVHVLVWGVNVQGAGSTEQIAAAIAGFNSLSGGDENLPRPDLLIVARGGGSLEDLWSFNEEIVVRAVAASEIAVISAVGHETDTTLVDFAADLRAPTPTAAAELATPVAADIRARLSETEARLTRVLSRRIELAAQMLRGAERALTHPDEQIARRQQSVDMAAGALQSAIVSHIQSARLRLARLGERIITPQVQISTISARLGRAGERLDTLLTRQLERAVSRLSQAERLLAANSFERVLERGFALVTDSNGKAIRRSADAPAPADILLRFADASRHARLSGQAADKHERPSVNEAARKTPPQAEQEELF